MTNLEALKIVYELAMDNCLDYYNKDDIHLGDEYTKQQEALEIINKELESKRIIDSYPDGSCPDCYMKIPLNVINGDYCGGHCPRIFVLPRGNDD